MVGLDNRRYIFFYSLRLFFELKSDRSPFFLEGIHPSKVGLDENQSD